MVVSKKQSPTVEQLIADYLDMEGERIPYAGMGYLSVDDFLRKCGEFRVTKRLDGKWIVSANKSPADEHMAKLVKQTPTTGKRITVRELD